MILDIDLWGKKSGDWTKLKHFQRDSYYILYVKDIFLPVNYCLNLIHWNETMFLYKLQKNLKFRMALQVALHINKILSILNLLLQFKMDSYCNFIINEYFFLKN